MARSCSICRHADRDAIDRALVEGQPYRDIAGLYDLSKSAVERHGRSHLPATLTNAAEAEEVARADSLLAQLRALQERALGILAKAEGSGDFRTALLAIREARGCLELFARLAGELQTGTDLRVVVAPEWIHLRGQVLDSLKGFPEARQAVAEALLEASSEG